MDAGRIRGVGLFVGAAAVWLIGSMLGGGRIVAQGGAGAQGPPPARFQITTTQVKPDMVLAWQDLIRNEVIPAQKKGGLAWRWVFATGPLGPSNTFTTVTPIANYAQYDQGNALRRAMGNEAFERYQAKVRTMIVGSDTIFQTLIANASLQSFSSTPPALVTVQTIQLHADKAQEFTEATIQDWLPAYKKLGVTDYWVFATNFGGSTLQRTVVRPIANYAELDTAGGPLVRAGVAEEVRVKANQRRSALIADQSMTVMRFVPELSYGVPQRPSGTR